MSVTLLSRVKELFLMKKVTKFCKISSSKIKRKKKCIELDEMHRRLLMFRTKR